MKDPVSQNPQRDDQRLLNKNAPNAFLILSVILSASFLLFMLGFAVTKLSRDDCTTTTTRYADGRVVSERICE